MKESDTSTGVQQRRRVNEHAKKMVAQKFRDSSLPDHFAHLPKFTLNDIVMGKFLGHGNFGRVMEVISLDRMHSLSPSRKNTESKRGSSTRSNFASFGGASSMKKNRWFQRTNTKTGRLESEEDEDNYCYCDEEDDDEEESLNDLSAALPAEDVLNKKQETARKFMQEHCLREHPNGKPSARYAIKILKDDVLQDPNKLYFQGIMDMAGETRLLSNLQHPNIIKLRGVGNNPCTEKYFLILDRLYEVLEDRWKVWQKKKQRFTSVLGILDRKGLKRAALWEERVIAAHDLASGLSYLHSKKIIHRDIKSDNIGFDVRGDIKVS